MLHRLTILLTSRSTTRRHCSRRAILLIGPRMTILSTSSDKGRCKAFASSHGALYGHAETVTSMSICMPPGRTLRHGLVAYSAFSGAALAERRRASKRQKSGPLAMDAKGGASVGCASLATSDNMATRTPAPRQCQAMIKVGSKDRTKRYCRHHAAEKKAEVFAHSENLQQSSHPPQCLTHDRQLEWNRVGTSVRPGQPSPTIGQCLNGGLGWLEVECNRCKTRASLPLEAIRRPRDTPIWKLEASLKCRSCRNGRSAPPVRMIKLTAALEITPYKWVHSDQER